MTNLSRSIPDRGHGDSNDDRPRLPKSQHYTYEGCDFIPKTAEKAVLYVPPLGFEPLALLVHPRMYQYNVACRNN